MPREFQRTRFLAPLLGAVALASVGAGAQWGCPVGLMVAGGLMIGLTLLLPWAYR